ncbi:MAG: hypothetical protein HQK89_10390 [Nitrospirae bacterium]|nr:hypothetical protein [Nitrospirota bacterium]
MKVSDMTVEELEVLIERVVGKMLDPDYGLELNDELKDYLESHKDDKSGIPHEEVKKQLEEKLKMVTQCSL